MRRVTFAHPIGAVPSDRFEVEINGFPAPCLPAPVCAGRGTASFVTFEHGEAVQVRVRRRTGKWSDVVSVHPQRLDVEPQFDRDAAEFYLAAGTNAELRCGEDSLYFFGHLPAEPPTSDVIRFSAGQVHDAGLIMLKSGQTLWIEPGAIVRGLVRAMPAENVHIGGGGVLQGLRGESDWGRFVMFDGVQHASVSDVTMTHPPGWMLVLGGCDDVQVKNLHEIGDVVGSDGIDVVGSRDVRIQGGFLRNNDDCVVIKAFRHPEANYRGVADWARDVRDVHVEGVTVANDRAGNALEIGHELTVDRVGDITFRDIDILHCHGAGAPISINCGDRASVEDVTFEDVRIEHHYDKWLSIRVMRSRFNQDAERGQIRNVRLRRVVTDESIFNAGYTTSVIGGWDAEHRVSGVHFEECTYGGRVLKSIDDLEIYTRYADDITFSP